MYIRAYPNGKFRCEVNLNGQSASKLCDNRAEARAWGQAKEAEFETLKVGKNATFAAAKLEYLEKVSTRKKDGAVLREGRRLEDFEQFFGANTPLHKIDKQKITKWVEARVKSGVTGDTVVRDANLLRNLFSVARTEWEWISHNPFEGVWLPEEGSPRTDIWGWREIRRVLRYCQASEGPKTQQCGIAFHIALRTGLRLKEVLLARLDGMVIVINDSKTTRKGVRVTIPTTHQTRRIMQKYKGTEWTFNANEASTLFHKTLIQMGIREKKLDGLNFHDTRATALTHLAKKMPVEKLQRFSRHRNINILVNTYYRETNENISKGL